MTWSFWQDALWRSLRTMSQCLAGLLVTSHVSSAFNAPWHDLLGASLLAGATSLLMSIDRSTVTVTAAHENVTAPAQPAAYFAATPAPGACGSDLR